MHEKVLSPHAASLSQSMRDLGYSLEAAIADLIDNSITARAENINILFDISTEESSSLAIIDDGCGMDEVELFEAMRLGSRDPRESRDTDDLGRFGLGLKTASFSQCRSLTVVSRKNNITSAAIWDLDTLTERNSWIVTIPSEQQIQALPFIDQLGSTGTYVLWRKIDRLLEKGSKDRGGETAYEKLDQVERHLSLVFHRYLGSDYKKRKIVVFINGHQVESFDPFCLSNKATQALHEEIVRIGDQEIRIQPYILPHHSKLSRKEYDFYKNRSDFVSNQGTYVYRNGRLMAWGDWFRLVPRGEATKLARVRIDFPNTLDEYWTIDIKKSRATPPYQVREKLRQIINRIAEQSTRVHKGRGDRLFDKSKEPLWLRYGDRQGIRYTLNRDHSLIEAIEKNLPEGAHRALDAVLGVIEKGLPIEAIYADYSSSPQSFEQIQEISREDMKEKLESIYMLMSVSGNVDREHFTKSVLELKPFSEHQDITKEIIEELVHA
ncbi:Histidine kinase-, DNA gyrase B-, and HSP90-like ATPase [Nitrosomonas aestuarii]|uniref:Histidine kinase-, DNA gyrase B-, and HSP90-like ATPase n=1 Tax=Nitrosomonas aestuarii TaxID=52441 RepID=A0A1I4BA56_9PROT|nr:ATP-binding protein [Nitrosomonas aestuarii]SFK64871.1 Histidine kinase-, DNA gyrase B-, and HSP90-like ATPase [Nitrosomonas aestuarii]